MVVGNNFEVLRNQVMQCGVRKVRRQKVVEQKVKCFRYGEEGHKKWECPQTRQKRREEEVALLRKVWEKIREYCGAKRSPLQGAVISMEGWTTK